MEFGERPDGDVEMEFGDVDDVDGDVEVDYGDGIRIPELVEQENGGQTPKMDDDGDEMDQENLIEIFDSTGV